MSDPRRAQTLLIELAVSNDDLLTCVVCSRDNVDYEFETRLPGRRMGIGLHHDCAERTGVLSER